ncbi:hypothetical protein [Mycolicibacterium palauense]|uniref:hypothetical protein n=1 Tax=Mycolicibacterium palauense TaxID=2034511 RepID=UPI0011456E25|nr:hypothetical protein [Mycolicibacterium palauense]
MSIDDAAVSAPLAGVKGFAAELANILLLLLAVTILFVGTFRYYEWILAVLVSDLAVAVFLRRRGCALAEIGRGLLLAWWSIPLSVAVIGVGIAVAHAIGPL